MNKQTKLIYKRLREFAEENKCDSVMFIDGTVQKFLGDKNLAIAIFKWKNKKLYEVNKD